MIDHEPLPHWSVGYANGYSDIAAVPEPMPSDIHQAYAQIDLAQHLAAAGIAFVVVPALGTDDQAQLQDDALARLVDLERAHQGGDQQASEPKERG